MVSIMKRQGTTYKKPSAFAATHMLQIFFREHPADSITPDEIIVAAGRNTPEFEAKNKGWLSNRLTPLYDHNLLRPVYSHQPFKKLEKLELTINGKRALGRAAEPGLIDDNAEQPAKTPNAPLNLTLDQMMEAVELLNAKHTTFQVELIVKPRTTPMEHR